MEHETEAAAGAAQHGAESAAGMPQLDPTTFPNQVVWLVIALIAIYLILTRIALPRIGGILSERQGTITNDVAAAEELKLKAEEAERSYQKSLADARSEANRIAEETRAEIQKELDAETAKADERIAEKTAESEKAIAEIREGAKESVRQVAREAAAEVVAVMGGDTDQGRIDQAVDSRVKG